MASPEQAHACLLGQRRRAVAFLWPLLAASILGFGCHIAALCYLAAAAVGIPRCRPPRLSLPLLAQLLARVLVPRLPVCLLALTRAAAVQAGVQQHERHTTGTVERMQPTATCFPAAQPHGQAGLSARATCILPVCNRAASRASLLRVCLAAAAAQGQHTWARAAHQPLPAAAVGCRRLHGVCVPPGLVPAGRGLPLLSQQSHDRGTGDQQRQPAGGRASPASGAGPNGRRQRRRRRRRQPCSRPILVLRVTTNFNTVQRVARRREGARSHPTSRTAASAAEAVGPGRMAPTGMGRTALGCWGSSGARVGLALAEGRGKRATWAGLCTGRTMQYRLGTSPMR